MRVVVCGASGFLGQHLVRRLRADGHQVLRLVRRVPRAEDEAQWQPHEGGLEPELLEPAEAVINLCGVGVADKRWNRAYKQRLRESRVRPTRTVAETLAAVSDRPSVLLNASAIGWYGDTGDHAVDESTPPGEGYYPDLCTAWEAATRPAAEAGVRVTTLRSGLVLAASGGLLKPMLPLFRLGLGGRLASGRQYMSWISLADWLDATLFLLERSIAGPVNLTGPHPETNAEFTRALGRVLRRPTVLPVPRIALRVALGEFGNHAVSSGRVLPGVLTRSGYRFRHTELEPALRWALDH